MTFSGADTFTPPTVAVSVSSTSTPVLLNPTPMPVAVAVANPAPRFNAAVPPVACKATVLSAFTRSPIMPPPTPTRTASPAVSQADAFADTATRLPPDTLIPKSPLIGANPATCAFSPVTTTEVVPWLTFSGADMLTPPTAAVSVSSTSKPVLLYATPTPVAVVVSKPDPRFNSTIPPVACKATFPMEVTRNPTVPPATPTRTPSPVVSRTDAFEDTAVRLPSETCIPKSPVIRAKPPICASNPVTATEVVPSATFTGAEIPTPPTVAVSVSSTSIPVLLYATPTPIAVAVAKAEPGFRIALPPVA